jgi:uncharacterized membrane protein HdeD (DUF308 family)
MDTRLSCLIRGIIGVVFGLIALLFPGLLLEPFYIIFLLLTGLAIAVFLFLAITSKGDESPFWFGLSAVLLVVVVLSFLVQQFVNIIFLLIIAGIAFYNGFTDVTHALTHPKTKYILIPGMFIAGSILLAGLLWYFPSLSDNLIIVILGTFAFVFGLVSILLGVYHKESPKLNLMDEKWTTKDKTCQFQKPEGKN